MVPSTPQQPEGPSNSFGSSQPTGQTPLDILLIIFIHGYCVTSIYMRGRLLVTRTPLPVSKETTRHLETFLRDYSISSQRMLRAWWLNLLSFRSMKCVSSRVFFFRIYIMVQCHTRPGVISYVHCSTLILGHNNFRRRTKLLSALLTG
jgi:hypothetical protein